MSEDAPRGEEDPAVVPPADPWAQDPAGAPTELGEPVDPDAGAGPQAPPPVAPGGTSILPTVPGAPAGPTPPAEQPRWSARAQVRTPEPDADAYAYQGGAGWEEDERGPRSVMTPVLITIAVVLLLLLIGTGIWLILRDKGASPTPNPTQSTSVPTTAPATTRPAPTTTPPPQSVPVPEVRGLTYAAAAAIITDSGFVPARSDEASADVPAGRVIGTSPPEGNVVRQGTTITIIVSTGPPAPPTTAGSPSGAAN